MRNLLSQRDLSDRIPASSSAITQARQENRPVKGHPVGDWAVYGADGTLLGYDPPAHIRTRGEEPDSDPSPDPDDSSSVRSEGTHSPGRAETAPSTRTRPTGGSGTEDPRSAAGARSQKDRDAPGPSPDALTDGASPDQEG